MNLFFTSEIDGSSAFLNESEAIHCRQALRKNIGDVILITDGKGNAYHAEIAEMGKKRIKLTVVSNVDLIDKHPFHIHLAIAPTKNISRYEWLLEKATEIGIDSITPLLCARSERKVVKPERLEKILLSAMKQSLKTIIPKLEPMTKFSEFILKSGTGKKLIAHLDEESIPIVNAISKCEDLTILIGPEGDFTVDEIELALKSGFTKVSLGNYRLRTETAGLAAVHTVHVINSL